jgi:hypothetical protein
LFGGQIYVKKTESAIDSVFDILAVKNLLVEEILESEEDLPALSSVLKIVGVGLGRVCLAALGNVH